MRFVRQLTHFLSAHHGVCRLGQADTQRLHAIIQEGDNPEAVAALIVGCEGLSVTWRLELQLLEMIWRDRQATLGFLLPRLHFDDPPEDRDRELTRLLKTALYLDNLAIADMLLGLDFDTEHQRQEHFWLEGTFPSGILGREHFEGRSGLAEHKAFIDRHQARAADLAPTVGDLRDAWSPEEAMLLIDVALYCDSFGNGNAFDMVQALQEGVGLSVSLGVEGMAAVVRFMLDRGMPLKEAREAFGSGWGPREKAFQILNEQQEDE